MSTRQRQKNPEENPQIGTCTCPICGGEGARVHVMRKSTVRKLKYYFCDHCGCIQPTLDAGQAGIMATFEPFPEYADEFPAQVPAPEPAPGYEDVAPTGNRDFSEPAPDEVPAPDEAPDEAPQEVSWWDAIKGVDDE